MKAIITATPEVSVDRINSVVNILTKIKGPISFLSGSIIPESKLGLVTGSFSSKSDNHTLEFDDFFKVCDTYRFINNTPDDEFVIVLTSIKNEKEWFSSFKNQNIFVYIPIWDELTPNNPDYAVAHQIIENVFQSLIKLNIEDVPNEPNIHLEVNGCINDFCEEEEKVLTKLKMAEICVACQKRAKDYLVDTRILIQIKEIIESLRKHFLDFQLIQEEIDPEPIFVDDIGQIFIGEKKMVLDPLHKTLLIFFLIHRNDRIMFSDLEIKKEELKGIYYYVKGTSETSSVNFVIEDSSAFSDKKSKLKGSLTEQIGIVAKHYWIGREEVNENGKRSFYHQLSLNPKLIHISPEFIKKIGF